MGRLNSHRPPHEQDFCNDDLNFYVQKSCEWYGGGVLNSYPFNFFNASYAATCSECFFEVPVPVP